ncbi:MAG: S8 family serine peptidase, partial [Cyclobacteriaceae bacterium]
EQGAFCGVIFISGAGNFAAGNNFAPVPVQMRIPEDIPNAVLGVAGVGQDGNRPPFSSQGPVEWNTDYYKEGTVNKPDFATLNFKISCVDLEGNLSNIAGGNSFAGPHMAGIVSLMLSANPELLPWEIKEILKKTAKDIGEPGFDYQSGYGFVNAYDAVTEVLKRGK